MHCCTSTFPATRSANSGRLSGQGQVTAHGGGVPPLCFMKLLSTFEQAVGEAWIGAVAVHGLAVGVAEAEEDSVQAATDRLFRWRLAVRRSVRQRRDGERQQAEAED